MPQANLQALFKGQKVPVSEPKPKQVGRPKGSKHKKIDEPEEKGEEKGEELEVPQEKTASVEAPIAKTTQSNFGG